MAGRGKIARLPRKIREELNRRLQDNEPGGSLLAWLNALPAVSAVLAREFGGCAINKQNLSEWRAGGYGQWQVQQELLAGAMKLAEDATELAAATEGKLTDHLTTVLAARYAAFLAGWNGEVTEEFRRTLRVLHGLCQNFVELHRGHHSGARLKMEQDRLEREREKTEEEVVAHFLRWAKNSKLREVMCDKSLSEAEKRARMLQLFGMAPKSPKPSQEAEPAEPNEDEPPLGGPSVSDESNLVKPSQT